MPIIIPGPGGFGGVNAGGGLRTLPSNIDMAITEILPYSVDLSNYMKSGDNIQPITQALFLASTGQLVNVAWAGSYSLVGNVLSFPIFGSVLQRGQRYQIQTTVNFNTNKILTYLTDLA